MIELTDKYKLFFRSTADINEAFSNLVTRIGKDEAIRFSYKGEPKRPTRAAILNAMVIWLASLPREEQSRVISGGMAALNAHLDTEISPFIETKKPPVPVEPEEGAKVSQRKSDRPSGRLKSG